MQSDAYLQNRLCRIGSNGRLEYITITKTGLGLYLWCSAMLNSNDISGWKSFIYRLFWPVQHEHIIVNVMFHLRVLFYFVATMNISVLAIPAKHSFPLAAREHQDYRK